MPSYIFGYGYGYLGGKIFKNLISYLSSGGTFTFTTNALGNSEIVNYGSGNNGSSYAGRGVELGATNELPIPTHIDGYITYHNLDTDTITQEATDGTDKVFNGVTVNNILTHSEAFDVASLVTLQANPNLLVKLGVSTGIHSISELNVALTASDAYYACGETGYQHSPNAIVNSRHTSGTDIADNTNTETSFTAEGTNTKVTTGDWIKFTYGNYARLFYSYIKLANGMTTSNLSPNTSYAIYVPIKTNDPSLFVSLGGSNISQTTALPLDGGTGEKVYVVLFETASVATDVYLFVSPASSGGYVEVKNKSIVIKDIDSSYIANYTGTIRTNADQLTTGLQTTCLTLDSAGVPTAYREDALEWHGNEYANTQWNPSLESVFWLEEIINGVIYQHDYDGTNLTTYTDNVAGTPTAHSPENASYLLGKGAYPKVAADTETTYVSAFFSVETVNYATYNQATRYTALATL